MKRVFSALVVTTALVSALPSYAQLGGLLKKAEQVKQAKDSLTFSDAEEQQLGSDISTKLRDKYGVVQDKSLHTYVTLVGASLASESSRPNLSWTFIVLDTDGVNAFAAPGGFIHITRGALALIQNEAELADVLAHEIGHVTAKHTIRAIQKGKVVGAGASATRNEFLQDVANRGYEIVLENSFDRGDEMEADNLGVTLASKLGYAPAGLAAFLTRLSERNKDLKDRSGLFASHPETKARVDALGKLAAKLTTTATVAARYQKMVPFKSVPVAQVSQGSAGSPEPAKPAESKSGGGKFGLSGLSPLGNEKSSNQTVASAGSRGVNPDRDAKGGPNKSLVVVSVTRADIAEFRKGIVG